MSDASPLGMLTNGVKLVGETMLPGASLLMDGNLVNGAAHAAIGVAAATFVAPWAVLLVVADSFSKSVSGKNLWDHINIRKKTTEAEVVAA
ncbi:MAG: hypothetical protein CK528_11130 [Alcaligenaceae bacterium]|nr:MAG: hypothetical protein CK528_11130 [Alcaligenaceae bacterium]